MWKRARGLPETDADLKKKAAYFAKLGLANKFVDPATIPPWHLNHLSPGDVFEGTFEHPEMYGGEKMDLTLTVSSPTQGKIESDKGKIEETVEIMQDFPIAFEPGEARTLDQAHYIFCKFNSGWRDFDGPLPAEEECFSHLTHGMLQLWFEQATQVAGFPSEAEFRESAADPDKGMTMEEFLKYTTGEDPEYLDKTFKGIFTGRRIQLTEDDMEFDGDFVPDATGSIFGYMLFKGREGGQFEISLRKAS